MLHKFSSVIFNFENDFTDVVKLNKKSSDESFFNK